MEFDKKKAKAEMARETHAATRALVTSLEYELKLIGRPTLTKGALVKVVRSYSATCPHGGSDMKQHAWLVGQTGTILSVDRHKAKVRLDGWGLEFEVNHNELELQRSNFWEWMRPSWQLVFQEERRQLKLHQKDAEQDLSLIHISEPTRPY